MSAAKTTCRPHAPQSKSRCGPQSVGCIDPLTIAYGSINHAPTSTKATKTQTAVSTKRRMLTGIVSRRLAAARLKPNVVHKLVIRNALAERQPQLSGHARRGFVLGP